MDHFGPENGAYLVPRNSESTLRFFLKILQNEWGYYVH